MPRVTKERELQLWTAHLRCYMFRLTFQWEPANGTICILSETEETAIEFAQKRYISATKIEYLGAIEKLVIPNLA